MTKHRSQTSTCSSISSSESPSSTMSSSCRFWYSMTATCTCLCMLVHLSCMYTLAAYRNGHTCKPTIPRENLVLVATASTLGMVWHCGKSRQTTLPDCCLVVSSNEVHQETISACYHSRLDSISPLLAQKS